MKNRSLTFVLIFLLGLGAGMLLAFCLTRHQRMDLPSPHVSVETINGKDAVVVSVQEHSPISHSHIYDVDFDNHSKNIDLAEYQLPWHPFSKHIWDRPPIVIQNGLLPGNYALRTWNDGQFVELGRVIVADTGKIEWRPRDEKKNE